MAMSMPIIAAPPATGVTRRRSALDPTRLRSAHAGRRNDEAASKAASRCQLAHHEWIGRRALRGRYPDALGFRILVDGIDPALASDTRMLHAAERHHVADGPVGVHPHRSGAQQLRHAHGTGEITSPDA